MGELKDKQEVVIGPEFPVGGQARLLHQPPKSVPGFRIDPELARMGAAVTGHGSGLEPDHAGSPLGETLVPAQSELGRAAGRISVGSFHR